MWFEKSGNCSDIVISSRVRLARNLKGYKFPGLMSGSEALEIIDTVSKTDALKDFDYLDISKTDSLAKTKLIEQHIISRELAGSKLPCGVFTDKSGASVMVCEEDHLRLQSIVSGYDLEKAFDIVNKIDNGLEKQLDYAFSEKYGYLTKCPTNVGTGMRASVMMHLPALAITNNIGTMTAAVNKLGVTVRGLYGEGSKAKAHIYQISNQFTLGVSEAETIAKLKNVVDMLIEKERKIAATLYENNTPVFKDKILRAYGLLSSSYIMSSEEFMNLLPYLRLGVNLGIIGNVKNEMLNSLLVQLQPAHVMSAFNETDAEKRDIHRGEILRKTLKCAEIN